jgi:hypothetical protein
MSVIAQHAIITGSQLEAAQHQQQLRRPATRCRSGRQEALLFRGVLHLISRGVSRAFCAPRDLWIWLSCRSTTA